MIVDVIIFGLIFYLMFPTLTGYCAYHYGRSFLTWFIIGCFLPIISFFVLLSMVMWNEKTTPRHKMSRREQVESDRLVEELLDGLKGVEPQMRKRKPVTYKR